ncbi:tunicamycin resistance protein [Microbotryomycetes sp. JL221]|nr:tunicamycin resistance protein [Microbotryomycetes sp. JL221]
MSHDVAEPVITLLLSCTLSLCAYKLTAVLVPMLGPDLLAKGLGGRDMLKPGFKRDEDDKMLDVNRESERIRNPATSEPPQHEPGAVMLPEATGVIGASVYILLLSLFAPLPYLAHLMPTTSTWFPSLNTTTEHLHLPSTVSLDNAIVFPHHSFATYLASLLSLLIATFLGFLDDVFDIRWRFKLPIPIIASVPLLVTYAAGHGITDIVLPRVPGLRPLFKAVSTNGVIHLGALYYVYMSMLSTFCTNSINILAGVNGVEVGQALVIALSIAINDFLYLILDVTLLWPPSIPGERRLIGFGFARGSVELADRHLFSLYFMLPLIGVCFGLLKHNWYPARAFIGDTFCYFAGMAFAVVGILGHFSKTLLLFFLPQIFNFLYSCPQLFGFVPCPRHRLPRLDIKTGTLVPSYAALSVNKRRKLSTRVVIETLNSLGLVKVVRDNEGFVEACSNLTILNLILVRIGRDKGIKEDKLTMTLMMLQAGASVLAFAVRYGIAQLFYDGSRR